MKKITEFKEIAPYENYDYSENPCRYNSLELVPKALVWKFNDVCHSIYNNKGIQASLIDDDTRILIIDGVYLYDEKNKAYVINGEGKVEIDVSNIMKGYSFSGFYFQGDEILFFAYNISERIDYLIKFDKRFKYISKNIFK